MIVTHKAEMDLVNRNAAQWINAVQGDVNTRVLELYLYSNGTAWEPPDGVTVAMRYQKPDGTKGYYDTLPDGAPAWSVAENVITITMAPQMLTVAGMVLAQVEMVQDVNILATFAFQVNVEGNPAAGTVESEDYVNWLQWMKSELNAMLEEAKESGEFDGEPGPKGPQGPQGETGPAGKDGADGKTAYEYAQDGGYTGTEADFAKKLATEYLPLGGGDMLGPINMNGQALTGLNAPESADGAANKGYVDALENQLTRDISTAKNDAVTEAKTYINDQLRMARPVSLFVNANFRKPVNQRRASSIIANNDAYTPFIDCWLFVDWSGKDTGLITLTENGISVTNEDVTFYQRFEKGTIDFEKTYTLAVYYDDGTVEITYNPVIGESTFDVAYFVVPSGKVVSEAGLYEGEYTAETLPEHQPKDDVVELTDCLRYFHLYATEAARPSHGLDCSPPMRIDAVTQGTLEIDGVTYYYNSADL